MCPWAQGPAHRRRPCCQRAQLTVGLNPCRLTGKLRPRCSPSTDKMDSKLWVGGPGHGDPTGRQGDETRGRSDRGEEGTQPHGFETSSRWPPLTLQPRPLPCHGTRAQGTGAHMQHPESMRPSHTPGSGLPGPSLPPPPSWPPRLPLLSWFAFRDSPGTLPPFRPALGDAGPVSRAPACPRCPSATSPASGGMPGQAHTALPSLSPAQALHARPSASGHPACAHVVAYQTHGLLASLTCQDLLEARLGFHVSASQVARPRALELPSLGGGRSAAQ